MFVEREPTAHVIDTSTISSFGVKVDDFFVGIFLPAAVSFENVRQQLRLGQQKTWQGMKSEINDGDPWPKPYASLV